MIKNTSQLVKNGSTQLQKKTRKDLCAILESVLKAIDPFTLVQQNFELKGGTLHIGGKLSLRLSNYKHIYVVGAGKAVYKMAVAVEQTLRSKIIDGWIDVPSLPSTNKLKRITLHEARHPTPDARGFYGAKQIKRIINGAGPEDLIVSVFSGGGSALMPLPAPGITLQDKIAVTSLFLQHPFTVHEMNVVRKHLSGIKGGQFACFAYPATVVGLYVSDIIGDQLDIQVSGPLAPDPSTFDDTIAILKKYEVWNKVPLRVKKHLIAGKKGSVPDTPNKTHAVFRKGKIYNFTVGNHNTAVQAAVHAGKQLGYHCLELTSSLQGEAREVSQAIVAVGKHIKRYNQPTKKPALIVAGGETTVYVRGKGKGGRNQELVLSAIPRLQDGMTLVSFGTDGVDGITPVPVAGAMADVGTLERGLRKKLNIQRYLASNDSYHFFKGVGDHIHMGYSGTNVGDLVLLVVR